MNRSSCSRWASKAGINVGPSAHQTHAGMLVTVNPPLMSLGQPEPPLQVQVVPRHLAGLAAGKESRRPAGHHLAQLRVERLVTLGPLLLQSRKLRPPLLEPAVLRVEGGRYQAHLRHLLRDHDPVCRHRGQAGVDALRQPG